MTQVDTNAVVGRSGYQFSAGCWVFLPHDEPYLFSFASRELLVVNPDADFVIRRLMSGYSMREIASGLSETIGDPIERILDRLQRFWSHLAQIGLDRNATLLRPSGHLVVFHPTRRVLIELNRDATVLLQPLVGAAVEDDDMRDVCLPEHLIDATRDFMSRLVEEGVLVCEEVPR